MPPSWRQTFLNRSSVISLFRCHDYFLLSRVLPLAMPHLNRSTKHTVCINSSVCNDNYAFVHNCAYLLIILISGFVSGGVIREGTYGQVTVSNSLPQKPQCSTAVCYSVDPSDGPAALDIYPEASGYVP